MLPGTPYQSRWLVADPRYALPGGDLDRLLRHALGECRMISIRSLVGGFRNANFKVQLEPAGTVVVRIYEHDPSLCAKEVDILRLVAGSVPVPELLHAEPDGFDDLPPFAVLQFVEGIPLRELKRTGDQVAIAQAARSAGEVLAAVGQFPFPRAGWIEPGLRVGDPLLPGSDSCPRFVDLCLDSPNLQARFPAELRERIHTHVWKWAPRLAALDSEEAHLVHCDFGGRNLLVRNAKGHWSVAAVLDWEFAVAGSPLIDVGHFLRYDRASAPLLEPHFSKGFQDAGGVLPPDWRQVARAIDLTALCESLTHECLPDGMADELTELVGATVEHRDPHF